MRVSELLDPAVRAPRAAIERHHLFPRAHLKQLRVQSTSHVNQIANMAFVEWPKNTAISGNDPAVYWPAYSMALSDAELEQQRFWHALSDGWETQEYNEFLKERRRHLAKVIKAGYERLAHGESEGAVHETVEDLIAGGETDSVEFKSTARYNAHTGRADPRLEHVVLKTVGGFANASGGTLLIGVNDDGELLGLDGDLSVMKKPDADRYQLWLTDLLETTMGKAAAPGVGVTFPDVNGSQLCRVEVRAAASPVFVRPPGAQNHEFWVRVGNSTRLFSGAEILAYSKEHWS